MTVPSNPPTVPLATALRRGLSGRCPACDTPGLFKRFLRPVECCACCARDWTIQRADDFPAYLAIFIVGHLLIPVVVEANLIWDLSMTAQMLLWPVAAAVLALALIQPFKGFVIALLWAR